LALREVTPEAFAQFLGWLDPDVEAAGGKYRAMHRRLVKVFVCWGFSSPEDLADRTLDRVAMKTGEIQDDYEGEPIAYVLGVARNIRREAFRSEGRERARLTAVAESTGAGGPPEDEGVAEETRLRCLDRCLAETLTPEESRLLLEYYHEGTGRVSRNRTNLAEVQGLSGTTLRKRTQRYRRRLEDCLRQCLGFPAVTEPPAAT
jgi:DNA-directed RNA polymerase specialized sigma24 family protein